MVEDYQPAGVNIAYPQMESRVFKQGSACSLTEAWIHGEEATEVSLSVPKHHKTIETV